MSRSLDGPWIAPVDDAFDGRAYYAGRTFCLNGQRILFGWAPTKEDCDDRKNFEWAGTLWHMRYTSGRMEPGVNE